MFVRVAFNHHRRRHLDHLSSWLGRRDYCSSIFFAFCGAIMEPARSDNQSRARTSRSSYDSDGVQKRVYVPSRLSTGVVVRRLAREESFHVEYPDGMFELCYFDTD